MAKETSILLGLQMAGFHTLLAHWVSVLKEKGANTFWNKINICWKLWSARNRRLFNGTQLSPATLAIGAQN